VISLSPSAIILGCNFDKDEALQPQTFQIRRWEFIRRCN